MTARTQSPDAFEDKPLHRRFSRRNAQHFGSRELSTSTPGKVSLWSPHLMKAPWGAMGNISDGLTSVSQWCKSLSQDALWIHSRVSKRFCKNRINCWHYFADWHCTNVERSILTACIWLFSSWQKLILFDLTPPVLYWLRPSGCRPKYTLLYNKTLYEVVRLVLNDYPKLMTRHKLKCWRF